MGAFICSHFYLRKRRSLGWRMHHDLKQKCLIDQINEALNMLVPTEGLEPPHPKAHGPEPCASTNSATWATKAEIIYYY